MHKMTDIPANWGVTFIDLDGDVQRQVIVDREPGQYLGHPTTVMLDDGQTMLIVYPKGHGKGPIVLKKSYDAGLTWSERLPVPQSWATSREVPTIYRMRGESGEKCLVMFSGLYPIRIARSDDEGESWSELAPIGEYGGIVAMADMVRLKDGSYMAFFHDDGRFFTGNFGEDPAPPKGSIGAQYVAQAEKTAPVFRVYATTSKDLGRTWSPAREILQYEDAHLCEPGVIRSPDGKELLMLLRENSRKYNAFMAASRDEGQTWGDLRELPLALTGDRHCLRYLPDGRLFISFRDTAKDSPTWGDWVARVGTYEDIIAGGPGQYRLRIKRDYSVNGGDCAYPAIEVLKDGTIVTTTYGHWEKGEEPYILSVRLNAAELDALN